MPTSRSPRPDPGSPVPTEDPHPPRTLSDPAANHLPAEAPPVIHPDLAEKIRNHADNVIDVGPMGCQTGFYVTVFGQDAAGGVDGRARAEQALARTRRNRPDLLADAGL